MNESSTDRHAGRRTGRRRAARNAGDTGRPAVPQLPWMQLDNPYPPMEPLSADQVEAIHEASLGLLENLGMEVVGDEALDLFAAGGADVDRATGTVRMDRGMVEAALAKTGGAFHLTPRNPGRTLKIGDNRINFGFVSGAPTFGTPENARANLAGGQLARRYGLPYRTSGCNASNTVDAQATWETMMSMWGAVMGHGNFIYHAAGWLEGGLVASFEKVVVDVEVLQHIVGLLAPIDTSVEELGVDAIASVAPGGHFFGAEHTLARYRTAFYEPLLSDWQNHESWEAAGGKDATVRATDRWQRVLADYEPPPTAPERLEALDAYVARRREAIGSGDP